MPRAMYPKSAASEPWIQVRLNHVPSMSPISTGLHFEERWNQQLFLTGKGLHCNPIQESQVADCN